MAAFLSGGTGASGTLAAKVDSLRSILTRLDRVVVAFSGGADSAFLAWMAHHVLGKNSAICVTAVSPSLAMSELDDCRALAVEWGLCWETVSTREMERPEYVRNGTDRCFHCKSELMAAVGPLAAGNAATVVLGVNLDDLGDHRPGQAAALGDGACFPLVEAGFTKAEVREASRDLGLRTWAKPAAACLSSRVPYGTPVTVDVLGRVGDAEAALRSLGFGQVRVRHYRNSARVELEIGEMARAVELRTAIVSAVKSAGYDYVTLDLEGFRSGNLNGEHAQPIGIDVEADR